MALVRVRGNDGCKQPDNTNSPRFAQHAMTYEQSFLDTCDANGDAPDWAIDRIMREHGSSLILMSEHVPADKLLNGREILNWLGY